MDQIPDSLEDEMALIGSILWEPDKFLEVAEIVDADSFFDPKNKDIWLAMEQVSRQGVVIQAIPVYHLLKEVDHVYITDCWDTVCHGANATYHAQRIRDSKIEREMVLKASELTETAYDKVLTIDEKQSAFETAATKLRETIPTSDEVDIYTECQEIMQRIENNERGIQTGFSQVDDRIYGLEAGTVTVIAGRTSMGKTAFTLNILLNVSQADPVAFFSIEMSRRQLLERLIISISRQSHYHWKRGNFTPDQWSKMYDAINVLAKLPLHIEDVSGLTVGTLITKSRVLKEN